MTPEAKQEVKPVIVGLCIGFLQGAAIIGICTGFASLLALPNPFTWGVFISSCFVFSREIDNTANRFLTKYSSRKMKPCGV